MTVFEMNGARAQTSSDSDKDCLSLALYFWDLAQENPHSVKVCSCSDYI